LAFCGVAIRTAFTVTNKWLTDILTQLPPNKKVRIAYMGKILKEGATLPIQGWKQGHVVNALVFNR